MTPEESPVGIERFDIQVYDSRGFSRTTTEIIREIHLEIFLNNQRVVTIACTGNHVKELAVGFLRAEGIIRTLTDLKKIEVSDDQATVNVYTGEAYPSHFDASKTIYSSGARLRRPEGDTPDPGVGTGTSLHLAGEGVKRKGVPITPEKVLSLMESLLETSYLHNITHGTHCSALANGNGILVLREDIGRHNTIDMIGGYTLLEGIDCSDKIILTTGRVSSEIVNKVGKLGAPVIISHSAPTSQAIHLLKEAGITLIGYVRGGKMNIYSQEGWVGS
ncbi:MAG: formate dehydrogenase accessory sulfurtransferase FdhD [Syntrophales bacterium]|nr:formate dehydrogenase accessory sulfurtransferase FdhD [Syntrophales bacterium]